MKLRVCFKERGSKQAVKFADRSLSLKFAMKDGQILTKVDIPHYLDEYEVTPFIEEQTLETKGKYMIDNVVVKPMPQLVFVSQDATSNILSIS